MQVCLFCGGDASEPDHLAHCDGRQGRVEAAFDAAAAFAPPTDASDSRSRYGRVLAVYQETSREAWDSVWSLLPQVDAAIVREIVARGGATSAEVEIATGLKHQTVSAQIRHMVEAGLLTDSGDRRINDGLRRCIVWRVVERWAAV